MPEDNRSGRHGSNTGAVASYKAWLARRSRYKKEYWDYVSSTTWIDPKPHPMDNEPNPYDAVNECKHGRLPHDKSHPCGCYDEG